MSDSRVVQQAQKDADLYRSFSDEEKLNLIREMHFAIYGRVMNNFPISEGSATEVAFRLFTPRRAAS